MRILRALAVLAVVLGSASAIEAQTIVTLAWDANTEPDLAGYEVSYGTQSGVYSTIVDVGNVTSTPFTLTSGIVYYFAVKAYNSSSPRQYSPYSIEVCTGLRTTPVITWANPAAITYGTTLGATQLNATASVAGTFVYTPASGTVLSAGTQTLSVTFTPTDTVNYTTATRTVTLTVAKATPVITWATPTAITYGTALGGTQLNATASVAGTFVYAPASGTVLTAGAQTLSVTFTPTDTVNYTTATRTVTLTVAKATPIITWANPASIVYGTALSATQLNATASVAGTFVYTPANGTVLTAGAQTLSVTFTPTDTVNYTTANRTVTLTVTDVVKTTPVITWATPATITYGTALGGTQLNATANVAGTFVYGPAAGTVLTAGIQTLSVTFTPTDTANYTTATRTVSLTVAKATPVITWANPAAITYGMALGATQLNATASVAGTFVYGPAAGTVLTAGIQTLSVTFTPTDAVNYTTATRTVTLTVATATPVITWANPASVVAGTALGATQLNATATVAGTFVYSPAAGTVLSAGAQTLSVTFTPTDTANYTTATNTVTLTVTDKVTPVITWANPAAITYGTALGGTQLNATTSVAGTFVYTPASGTLLTVGATQALSVTFAPTDTANYTTATRTVTIDVAKATPVITWATPAAITYEAALGGTQLNATASVAGTFVYSPAAGTVLTAGAQTLSVTFTPTDTANYATATRTVTLTVAKATPVITWAMPASVVAGTALGATQLNATANVAGTFVYTPAAGTVLTAGTQTLSVTFTPTDTANYATATRTVTLTVTDPVKTTPVITWANPATITYGTALSGTQLNATANVAGTFVYAPASGTVLTAGASQTLSVTFTPSDAVNYNSASRSVTIIVAKATPIVTWANPASITYGTAIGGTQLNATASVAGTFVYAPASGTVLTAGTQTLSVTFTPTGTANYTTATRTVTITVAKATPVITWANPAAVVTGTTLGATQLNATASVAGTFVYTPAAGTVLTAGIQTLSVTFTPTDAANYTTATRTVTLTVTAAVRTTPVITWAGPGAITYGTPLGATQLNATANVAGTFVYTPPSGTLLTAGTGRTLSVTFTPTDEVNYTTATRTVTINVARAVPVVTWTPPAAVVAGTVLGATQLNATASVAGTFVYNPAAGTVLTAGSQTLTVTFTPTDIANYTTATRAVSLAVTAVVRTTPVVTWTNPATITYGTALSGTQLNATANVAGTFVYTPASGTVLSAGTGRPLSVTFTPTDTANYTTAARTVTLTVAKATPAVTWTAPASVVAGTVLGAAQLNATASVAGTLVYSPAAGTVLTAGTQTLSVTFAPTDTANYTTATQTVTIDVTATTATDAGSDFNGDGKPDLLWRNATTGEVYVWYMDGATRTGETSLATVTDLNWKIVGTGDFNGDGKPDLLWRNTTRGENYIWFMDGVTRTGGAFLATVADLNWEIVGTADFDGDGKPDILWRNATTGENYVWYMNGVTRTGGAFLATVADLNWKIVGTGDFNGDGKPDLLWRNTSTGEDFAWYLNGLTRTGGAFLVTVADPNWSMAMVADFNGDSKPDILWRHSVTGQNILWYLNGATRVGSAWVLTNADPNWQIGQQP